MKTFKIISLSVFFVMSSACTGSTPTPTQDLEATLEIALERTVAAQPTNTATNTPTHTPTTTSSPAPTDTPAITPSPPATEEVKSFHVETLEDGWSRYHYQEDGFAVSLPPDWFHLDLSADDLDEMLNFASEANPQLGNLYSSTYLRSLAATGIKLMAVDTSVESLSSGIPTSLNIFVAEFPLDLALDEFVEINMEQLKNMLGESLLIENERIQLMNTEAEMLVYETEMNDVFGLSHGVVFRQVLVLDVNTQYVLTFATVREYVDMNLERISDIVQSFELVQ